MAGGTDRVGLGFLTVTGRALLKIYPGLDGVTATAAVAAGPQAALVRTGIDIFFQMALGAEISALVACCALYTSGAHIHRVFELVTRSMSPFAEK